MDTTQAKGIIESLRYGIPPDGYICELTVGREEEIESLRNKLQENKSETLLLNANYGAGKTHLLRFIREEALRKRWMVSLVTLDSKSGVRFDRLGQIIGAICRNLEVPECEGKGIRYLLNVFRDKAKNYEIEEAIWNQLHNNCKWDRIQFFETEPFFLGLRAWHFCDQDIEEYIVNWFQSPDKNSDGRPTYVYKTLVSGMRRFFRDARPREYFSNEKLNLSRNDVLCWAFLRDLHRAAQTIGLKGLILCFDEFEDIIYNMTRLDQKKMSFCNMFELFYGHNYRAQAYFAVTPDFVQKCKHELAHKGEYDYDFSQFDGLKQFEMTPINVTHLKKLCKKIISIHSRAYSWEPSILTQDKITTLVEKAAKDSNQDRVRQCIRQVVTILDRAMEE